VNRWPLRGMVFQLLLATCVVLLVALAERLGWEADWSQHGRNRVQPATAELLARLEGPLEITAYAPDQPMFRDGIDNLVARMRRSGARVDLAWIDPVREPERARAAGVRRPGEMWLRYGPAEQHLANPDERTLAAALVRLLHVGSPWIVSLRGHGERDLLGSAAGDLGAFGRLLETRGHRLLGLSLTEVAEVPGNAALLLVAAPVDPPSPTETARLAAWLDSGGSLLWLAERPLPEPLATRLGIATLPGRLVDAAAADAGLDDPTVAVASRHPAHPALEGIDRPLLFPGALALSATGAEGWEVRVLAASSPRSWNETGAVVGRVARDPAAGELPGPLPVALALSRGDGPDGQRVAIVGDADWLSDAWLGRGANRRFAVALVQWLTAAQGDADIPLPEVPDQQVAWAPAAGAAAAVAWLVLVPLALVFAAVRVRLRRRRE